MNLFSLNVTSMEIEKERVSSSQNEHNLGGGGGRGGCSKTNKDKQGGEGVKTWESWANVLFEWPLSVKTVASSVPTVLSLDDGDTITNPYDIAKSFNN